MTSETRNSTLRLAVRFARMRALFASFRSNTRANVAVCFSSPTALRIVNPMERELVGKQLRMQPVLQFVNHDRHVQLHHAQEPRDRHSGSLHSLSDHPEPDHLLQQRRHLRQQQDSQHSGRAAELRVAQLLLYGEHADGHHQRADSDVRASGEHRPRYELTGEFDLKGDACALSPAPASWARCKQNVAGRNRSDPDNRWIST